MIKNIFQKIYQYTNMTAPRPTVRLLPLLGPETRPIRPPPPSPVRASGHSAQQLITLPRDLLYRILAELSEQDLARICQASSELSAICKEEQFWKAKHTFEFGGLPPKPDQRLEFLERRVEKSHVMSHTLMNELTDKNTKLVLSVLKNPPPINLIKHPDILKPEERQNFDPDTLKLAKDVYFLASNSTNVYKPVYDKYLEKILDLIRPQPPVGRRPPPRRVLLSEDFESQINPNAKVFEQYASGDFDPIIVLIGLLYDNTAPVMKIVEELKNKRVDTIDLMQNLRYTLPAVY